MTQLEAAKAQLDRALRLFLFDGDFVSALTLAGAADGILGRMRERKKEEREKRGIKTDELGSNAFQERRFLFAWLMGDDSEAAQKVVGTGIREPRNAMNHSLDSGVLEFDVQREAEEFIGMAISDYHCLTGEWPDLYVEFSRATESDPN